MKLGFKKDRYFRYKCGIFHVMNSFAEQGHCHVLLEGLIKKSIEVFEIQENIAVMTYSDPVFRKELVTEVEDKIYLLPFFIMK